MKTFYILIVLFNFVTCNSAEIDVTQYCKDECKEVCMPCQQPIRCTSNQTDCGLGDPDPAFGGTCPHPSICIEKEFNCRYIIFLELFQGREKFYSIIGLTPRLH